MTNNNDLINLTNNKKPVELVQELKGEYKTPSFEEFMKSYEVDEKVIDSYGDEVEYVNVWAPKGSGPCKKDGCSCKLFKSEGWSSEDNEGKKWYHKSSVGGKIDWDGVRAEAGGSISYLKGNNGDEEYSLFGVSAKRSFSVGEDGVDVSTNLGLDLYKFKDKDKKISIRPNVDTGVSTEDGSLEVKAGGFGLSAGKYTGLNTPLGELKVNTDDCVIQ